MNAHAAAHLDTREIALAAEAIRADEDAAARAAFAPLLARLGRQGASEIWAAALDIVEADSPPDTPPTRLAPDCLGYCGESYIDDCEPCAILEKIRFLAPGPNTFTCECENFGPVAVDDDHFDEIFDHVDACPGPAARSGRP